MKFLSSIDFSDLGKKKKRSVRRNKAKKARSNTVSSADGYTPSRTPKLHSSSSDPLVNVSKKKKPRKSRKKQDKSDEERNIPPGALERRCSKTLDNSEIARFAMSKAYPSHSEPRLSKPSRSSIKKKKDPFGRFAGGFHRKRKALTKQEKLGSVISLTEERQLHLELKSKKKRSKEASIQSQFRSECTKAAPSLAAVTKFLRNGAGANAQDKYGWTALHSVCKGSRHAGIIDILVSSGSDPSEATDDGSLAVHYYVRSSPPPRDIDTRHSLDLLLGPANKLINTQTNQGETPLHHAVIYGNAVMVGMLIERGCSLNLFNRFGQTALHFAVARKRIDAIETLLKEGMDPHIGGGGENAVSARSPYQMALEMGNRGESILATFAKFSAPLINNAPSTSESTDNREDPILTIDSPRNIANLQARRAVRDSLNRVSVGAWHLDTGMANLVYTAVYENAVDPIVVHDLDGRIIHSNLATVVQFGYTFQELSVMTIAQFEENYNQRASDSYKSMLRKLNKTLIRTGRPHISYNTHKRKDGTTFPTEIVLTVCRNDGRTFLIAVLRDITERTNISKMEKARASSEASSRGKSLFLATMGHELRTPLHGVFSNIQIVLDSFRRQKSIIRPADLAALKDAFHSCKLLRTIVNDVLDTSRLELGMFKMCTGIFNWKTDIVHTLKLIMRSARKKKHLLTWIHNGEEVFKSRAGGKGASRRLIRVCKSRKIPNIYVKGDSVRVRQILLNLLTNAIKFTPIHGRVTLRTTVTYRKQSLDEQTRRASEKTANQIDTIISTSSSSSSSGNGDSSSYNATHRPREVVNIRVWVEDTGIGIPYHMQHMIFTMFRQVQGAITRLHGGTGLGLYICRKLVALMHGTIELESSIENKGSTFYFSLELPSATATEILQLSESEDERSGRGSSREVEWDDRAKDSASMLHRGPALAFDIPPKVKQQFGVTDIDLQMRRMCSAPQLEAQIGSTISPDEPFGTVTFAAVEHRINRKRSASSMALRGCRSFFAEDVSALSSSSSGSLQTRKPVASSSSEDSSMSGSDKEMEEAVFPKEKAKEKRKEKEETPAVPPVRVEPDVLMVEDNIMNQKIGMRLLNRVGISNVSLAVNGKKAVEIVQKRLASGKMFSVILMDLHMPIMGGIQATKEIAFLLNQSEWKLATHTSKLGDKEVAIIALTADTQEEVKGECFDVGMCGFLSKPVVLKVFKELFLGLDLIEKD